MSASLLLVALAHAGSCCSGSTSAVPMRPDECDRWVMGFGVGAETTTGRWDTRGVSVDASMDEVTVSASLGAGVRWADWGYATASLPALLTRKAAGDLEEWGGGAGDVRLGLFLDPIAEAGDAPWPVPVLGIGARLPTGRGWQEAEGALLADVTGAAGPAVTAMAGIERTLGSVPWSTTVQAELPLRETGAALDVGGAIGRYLGVNWTALATARYRFEPFGAGGAAETKVGVRLVRGERLAWRAWAGVEGALPVDRLGRASNEILSATAGFALVR